MTLAVDASVALKWVLEEEGSDRADAVLKSNHLVAPDFLFLECANVLAQQVRRGLVTAKQSEARLRTIEAAGVRLVPSALHVPNAHTLAVSLGQSAYDSLYLSVALAESVVLITVDVRFAEAARKAYGSAIRLL